MPFVQPNAPLTNVVNNGNGQIHLQFIGVGQGDCCVLKTPLGRIFLFDCGSVNHGDDQFIQANCPQNIMNALVDPNMGITTNHPQIDGVILSHPDRDHYNKIDPVMSFLHNLNWGVTVQTAFVSLHPDLFYQNYCSSWLSRAPYQWVTPINVHGVTVNRLSRQKFLVHWERLPDGREFKIEIISGNVFPANKPHPNFNNPSGDEKNTASLVTLIQFHNTKVLIMGDASTITGDFLVENFPNEISNLTIMHVPHHGSRRNTLKSTFYQLANPRCSIVSAPIRNDGDHLPAFEVLDYANSYTLNAFQPMDLPCYKYEGYGPWTRYNFRGRPPQIDDANNMDELASMAIEHETSDAYTEYDRYKRSDPTTLMLSHTAYDFELDQNGLRFESREAQLTYGRYSSSNDVWVTAAINNRYIQFSDNGH